jgi:FAD/FMN-containing dehydrogenase
MHVLTSENNVNLSNYLQLMRQIKDVFDPKGILNPGKIFTKEGGPEK